jgi:hypothetical protein
MCNTTKRIITSRTFSACPDACSGCEQPVETTWMVSYLPHTLTLGWDVMYLCEDCYSNWLENQNYDPDYD